MNLSSLKLFSKSFSTSLSRQKASKKKRDKQLRYEPLEPRLALAAAGLVDVGAQPEGALSGKIVYTSGGHGITWNGSSWGFQRPLLLNMIEDLGNQDQMTFFADYAFNAGATVVPLRPVGHQPNEIILDNDDAEVTFSGAWSDSSAGIYFGDPGDVPYRFASTSATETAVATYRPNVTEEGFYPVYAWTRAGTDRASDQLYRVNHSGGSTEVTINHRMVGTGIIYLGTYHFEAGTAGSVEISNRSDDPGRVVIADMIRFGNGVGDLSFGGGVSGRDRVDELSLYWLQWHTEHSQGVPSSAHGTSHVSAPARYAAYMNQSGEGSLSDRVYVGYHSNAGGGSARGVLGLYNGNNTPSSATPNQFLLANLLGREINDDLVDQDGQFEHDFFDRTVVTLDRSDIEFGEINNSVIGGEFDATIVEVAFHDNQLDAELMRDADFRAAAARATVQGLVRYFNSVDGGATTIIMAPGKATGLRAETVGSGSVTVSWDAPSANTYNGDAATGYMVYGSTNGYGFDGGTFVAGGGTTTHTFNGLDLDEGPYYFKVVPVNAGGAAPDSEVVAANPNVGPKDVLIINGFDRLSRQQNPVLFGAQRVRPRDSNSYDYVVQVASAIEANSPGLVVDTTSNEALIAGNVQLADYAAVFWILGEESTDDHTFDPSEQSLVSNYLASGGQLFVSGSEIAWDLDSQNNGQAFFNNSLRANYLSDDANSYNVQGAAGSIFEGLSFSFDNGSQFYNVDFPDVIAPQGGATTALTYVGGSGGGAGIQYDSGGATKVVNVAFPFETITSESLRNDFMGRVLDFFNFDVELSDLEQILDNDDGPAVYSEAGSWTTSTSPGFNGGTYRFGVTGNPSAATWKFYAPFAGSGEIFVQYAAGSNRADNAVYHIDTGNGIEDVSINQKANDATWVSLGNYSFTAGSHEITLDAQASSGGSVVIADVVRVFIPVPSTETADFDEDGDIDGRDFLAWQRGFGKVSPVLADGDANGDDSVDGIDLGIWQDQYGTVPVVASLSSSLMVDQSTTISVAPVSYETDGEFTALAGIAQVSLPVQEVLQPTFASARGQAVDSVIDQNQPSEFVPLRNTSHDSLYSQLAKSSWQEVEEDEQALELAFEQLGSEFGHF
ncbi:golvesin C-terminal-like domain-containing protein [Bythopirellula goksoeyrii]|uniref:AmiA-like protein n=1 Tax=Bythopirellula goksoeyrii TaxID=1400387 RepID=A0A5B9QHM1_9BACT|nr:hypothetical protein [Bythopirellula goksoeyrii]QEG36476.1 AmiA-like protein [Bythopirellula goksoeyrii]